jgi:transcriptional regulator with XRE-family HTH domain
MDVRRQLGLNVQRLRREKDWSQEKLAFESGIHRTYVSGLERGIRNPTITIVQKLADTLGVSFGALLDPPARRSRL